MNNSLFDDIIRQKANNHEAPVPANAWQNIMPEEKKRRRLLWLFLLPLLMAGAGLWIYVAPIKHKTLVTSTKNITDTKTAYANSGTAQTINASAATKENDDNAGSTNNELADPVEVQPTKTSQAQIVEPATAQQPIHARTTAGKLLAAKNHVRSDIDNPLPSQQRDATSSMEDKKITDDFITEKDEITKPEGNEVNGNILSAEQNSDPNISSQSVIESNKIEQPGQGTNLNNEEQFYHNNLGADSTTNTAQEIKSSSIQFPKTSHQKWRIVANGAVLAIMPGQSILSSLSRDTKLQNGSQSYFIANDIKFSYQPSLAVCMGIQKLLGKKWVVGAGLQYQHIKERISLSGIEYQVDTQYISRLSSQNGVPVLVNEARVDSTAGIRHIDALNSFRYINVPLYVQYKFLQTRGVYLAMQLGVVVNLSSSYHNSIQGEFSKAYTAAQHYNHWGFDVQAGLVAAKKLGSRFELFASPYWRLNKSKPVEKNLAESYLNQAGLSLGISYGLGH